MTHFNLSHRLTIFRLRYRLRALELLKRATIRIGSQVEKEQFANEWATQDQETASKWRAKHRHELLTHAGLALSQWAGMEEIFIGIAALLLRIHEANKVGIIMYSVPFTTWISLVEDLFAQEPRYITLKPKWNKLSGRLRGLKETRDRLAHHTIHYNDETTALAGGASLRPSQYDFRQKSQKYQPLDRDQIDKFLMSLANMQVDLVELLNAMT